MLHNCNVFEHIIVIYRFVIRKTWPLPCVLSFFLVPFRMTDLYRRSSGPGVMVVMGLASSFAATAMLRSLGRARCAARRKRRKGIPWEFHPLPMGWEDHQDGESKL